MDFLDEEFNEILNIFQVESEEIVARLNNSLLDLEKNPKNKDAILMLFRDAHSLKGASRLIGFNNVQTIAHKIEDILGLAKENKIHLTSNIVNVLYKTIDFLAEIIQKSIVQKHEIYSDDISQKISELENITLKAQNEIEGEVKTEFDLEIFNQNFAKINDLIADNLFLLMKIEEENNEELIQELLYNINDLHEIFKSIGLFDVKKLFEDIKVKLEFVIKASNSLTEDESEEIQQTLDKIITEITAICDGYDIKMVDYYSMAFEKASTSPKSLSKKERDVEIEHITKPQPAVEPQPIIEPLELQENFSNLASVKNKFSSLVNNNNFASEIIDFLLEFKKNSDNENINHVLENIINTLDFVKKNQIQLDEDTVSALEQGVEYCDNVFNNNAQGADSELILQRLEIVQKLLELKSEQSDDVKSVQGKSYVIKNKKIEDFSKVFDSGEIRTLRVDSAKLDLLVNQVGELMITKIKTKKHLHELNDINKNLQEWQRNSTKSLNYLKYYEKKYFAQIENVDNTMVFFIKQLLNVFSENNKNFQDVISGISSLHRTIQEDDTKMNLIVDDLEHMIKNVRVLPLATVFHLFGRMVRDIAQEKNKQIELEIIGSETSADKKIIEEIKTPLIHIIRNAIDHGIETPDERIALGKNPTGRILIKAYPSGNNVVIEIRDDGKGINIEKIKDKALKNGYLTKEEITSMTNEQLINVIFMPGFSTGDEITNISGRGIGLDIVQSKISQLNGKVKIVSEVNKGCCVQIELPTTMSTLKAFVVKVANKVFAIPMSSINTVVWKKAEEIFSGKNKKTITLNDKTAPIYYLSDILHLPKQKTPNRETILIIESDNRIFGLAVDKLIGDQEILLKKLSAPLYRLKNISGVTTLASGEICLILNMSDLAKSLINFGGLKIQSKAAPQIPQKKEDYKILLVDDSITTRTLEKNILTKAGYEIEIATNPLEAFEKMETMQFDLIISDVEMPEMNGFEFLEKIKTDEKYSDIPVIMVSSILDEEKHKQAVKLGARDFIIKHEFSQDYFLDKISAILEE